MLKSSRPTPICLEAPRYEATKASAGTGDDRTRVTCHVCGYKSVPQWLNDKAHCILAAKLQQTFGLGPFERGIQRID